MGKYNPITPLPEIKKLERHQPLGILDEFGNYRSLTFGALVDFIKEELFTSPEDICLEGPKIKDLPATTKLEKEDWLAINPKHLTKCNHDKIYSPTILATYPAQRLWICRKCGEEGSTCDSYDDINEYYKVKKSFKDKENK